MKTGPNHAGFDSFGKKVCVKSDKSDPLEMVQADCQKVEVLTEPGKEKLHYE